MAPSVEPRPRFVSEAITPVAESMTLGGLARGEPGLPGRFIWRGREYAVVAVRQAWKDYRPEGHSPGAELYLRKHWYRLEMATGEEMTVYCDRAARNPKKPTQRWWLHTIRDAPDP